MDTNKLKSIAKDIRREIIEISHNAGKIAVHYGSSFSIVDILTVLYGSILNYDTNNPESEDRDRFILSKGHAYAAFYATLCRFGFFSHEELCENFMTDGGIFPVHPVKNLLKGIECSSGSLGMGLSFGLGKALEAKRTNKCYTTYVLCGDGECNEGSVWESLLAAVQFKLDNLVLLIDHNKLQQDGMTSEEMNINFEGALKAIGWEVRTVNGNNIEELNAALTNRIQCSGKPFALICDTIKGCGMSFMENNNAWHHALLNNKHYEQALQEL